MTSPRWLTAEEISQINALQVEETGEPFLILNHGLLESAIGRPRNRHAYDEERDVVVLSVSLLFGLAKNHAFQQGNKRTATAAALLRCYRADSLQIAAEIGTRATADLITSHQLWSDWLGSGRVRKFAMVAEKPSSR